MSVLIVSRPGPLQSALQALITAIPRIVVMDSVEDVSTALPIVAERQPMLVLLDASAGNRELLDSAVRQIKANGNGTRCIVLADDPQQQQQAKAAGADGALLKGIPAAQLYTIIERLLAR